MNDRLHTLRLALDHTLRLVKITIFAVEYSKQLIGGYLVVKQH